MSNKRLEKNRSAEMICIEKRRVGKKGKMSLVVGWDYIGCSQELFD